MIEAVGAMIVVIAFGFTARPRPAARSPLPPASAHDRRAIRAQFGRAGRRPRRSDVIGAGEVAAWCEAMGRVVRSGSTTSAALRVVAPPDSCRQVVDRITLALERGRGVSEALDVRTASPHLTLALGVLRAVAINGGSSAEPLDRAAATLRARAAAAADTRTQSAQARLSAVVMTCLPIAMLALLLLTSSPTRSAVSSPLGLLAVGAGSALNLVGWRWMRRIIVGRPS